MVASLVQIGVVLVPSAAFLLELAVIAQDMALIAAMRRLRRRCRSAGRRGPLHRRAAARRQGAALPDQRQLEEARAAELGSKSRWMLGVGMVCLVGAVVCLGSAAWLGRYGLDRPAPPQDILQTESWW